MIQLRIQASLILLTMSVSTALAQLDTLPEFPTAREIKPIIKASISKDFTSLRYSYKLSNELGALQRIWSFLVEIRTDTFGIRSPSEWHSSNIKRPTIRAVTWASDDSVQDIFPASSLNGFVIMSNALPGMVRCFSSGFIDFLSEEEFNQLGPEFELHKIGDFEFKKGKDGIFFKEGGEFEFREGSNDIFYNSVTRITLGPLDPPLPFDHLAFLDTLASYKHQAVALGWIVDRREEKNEKDEMNDDGIVAKLDKRLDKAHAALVKGDSSKAREELREFVKKVEELYNETQEHEKDRKNDKVSFTSEAYALLKFNAEYLIDRLPKEKGERAR